MTKYGQRAELIIQLRDFLLTTLLIFIMLLFGGWIIHELEYDHEQENMKEWESLISNHYNALNTTQVCMI